MVLSPALLHYKLLEAGEPQCFLVLAPWHTEPSQTLNSGEYLFMEDM